MMERAERTSAWPLRVGLSEALARLPAPGGKRFAEVFGRGTDLSVEIYAPRGVDPQEPHRRDEIYVVVAGTGSFRCTEERALPATGEGRRPEQVTEERALPATGEGRRPEQVIDRAERFGPGDVLFAPAGAVHRFEDFTDDLVVWVMFFGPER